MATKPRNKQLRITKFLITPTPTNSRKKDPNTPMTRKRRRELEAELEVGNDSSGADSLEVGTPIHGAKRAKRSSKPTPKRTPALGKGKARLQQRDPDSDGEGKRASPSKSPKHRAVKAIRKAGNLLTPEYEGRLKSDPPEDSGPSSPKIPLAELKLGGQPEAPLPRSTRSGLRSSNVGLHTPIPTVPKSKPINPPKDSAKSNPVPPEHDPIIISSSPMSPLTDLPGSSHSPSRPRSPVQNSSPIFKIPALPLQTPRRNRAKNNRPGPNPLRNPATASDSDDGIVPTSQSQDLRPFFISPPRPGGTVLLKDTTPKLLRQSQGYTNQSSQPLPSVLATVQARDHAGTQETDIVPTSQMEEDELKIPCSDQGGSSRALAFSSPERSNVFSTPTKVDGLSLGGKGDIVSPIVALLYSPNRNSPTRRNDDGPSTSSLPPSSFPPSTDPHKSAHGNPAFDFVQYQTTPTKRRSSIDSPTKDLKFFESQTTLSPTWTQPRSFERWRLRDLLDSQRAFGDGKAGLEAEAEGREPGEGLKTTDGEEPEELANSAMAASSITEAESQDVAEWLLSVNPELRFGGKAPPYKSGSSSLRSSKCGSVKGNGNESGPGNRVEQVGIIVIDDTPPSSQSSKKSNKPDHIVNRIENVGMVPPVDTASSLTESDSQSGSSGKAQGHGVSQDGGGLGESPLAFSSLTLSPLMGFLDIFERGSGVTQDSQSGIDVDD